MNEKVRTGLSVGGGLILILIAVSFVPMPWMWIPICAGLTAIFWGGWPFWKDFFGLFEGPWDG